MATLDELAVLKDGWDGYGAPPTNKLAIETCRFLSFTPLSSGGILVELNTRQGSVDIEIDEYGRLDQVTVDFQKPKQE